MNSKKKYVLFNATVHIKNILNSVSESGKPLTRKELDVLWERLSRGELAIFPNGETSFIWNHTTYVEKVNCLPVCFLGHELKNKLYIERGKIYGKKDTRTGSTQCTKALRFALSRYGIYDGSK